METKAGPGGHKLNKAELAGAASNVLGMAKKFGKNPIHRMMMGKAESYLHNYQASHSTPAPAAAACGGPPHHVYPAGYAVNPTTAYPPGGAPYHPPYPNAGAPYPNAGAPYPAPYPYGAAPYPPHGGAPYPAGVHLSEPAAAQAGVKQEGGEGRQGQSSGDGSDNHANAHAHYHNAPYAYPYGASPYPPHYHGAAPAPYPYPGPSEPAARQ